MLQLLAANYTKEDFANMLQILELGLDAVCDGICESCTYDRACADVMRVNTHIATKISMMSDED